MIFGGSTEHKAPGYAVFSTPPSPHPSWGQISSSAPSRVMTRRDNVGLLGEFITENKILVGHPEGNMSL